MRSVRRWVAVERKDVGASFVAQRRPEIRNRRRYEYVIEHSFRHLAYRDQSDVR